MTSKARRTLSLALHILCILLVMAAAVLVRVPSSRFRGETEATRLAFTAESGVPYLTDMDSYYHVRLVNSFLETGSLGNSLTEEGKPWDSLSYYPEGRSADYQPGIVWLTAALHRLTGVGLDALEYRLAAFLSALAALAAYLLGWRIKGRLSGLTVGLLIACAPVYAVRTCYGRFDTDMFVILLELLLILFLTEALRAPTKRRRILFSLCFGLTAALFSLCWTPRNTILFGGLTLAGGFLYALLLIVPDWGGARAPRIRAALRKKEMLVVIGCGVLLLTAPLFTSGLAAYEALLTVLGFVSETTSSAVGAGVLPNLVWSISEMSGARLLPEGFLRMFTGYVAGAQPTIVNGTGGLLAVLLSFAGLCGLFVIGFRRKGGETPERASLLYGCVLGAWGAACLYLSSRGVRFIEHLSIPVALTAGCGVTLLPCAVFKKKNGRAASQTKRRALLSGLLCALAVLPAALGSAQAVAAARPSASDASANTMRYIREHAYDPEAVIASWWDMGYFYESEAGHPALWDGATQDGKRAILVSKALTTKNPELSRRILLMLSSSGNAALELLLAHTDAKLAFETLWEALLLEPEEAVALLQERGSLSPEEAREAEALLHPAQPKETYLVLTYSMTQKIAWYEYYANWDFTGRQAPPSVTVYSYTPEGVPLFDTESGQAYLDSVRGQETIWQLFFNAKKTACFSPVYEWHDGLEHVRVWLVEP